MEQTNLSDYARATYDAEDANPLKLAARASTADGHEFGDVGELHLTDTEGRELTRFLNSIYDL